MFEFQTFDPPVNVDDSVINAQFVEVQGISPEEETKLWVKYESTVHSFGKEKLNRFKHQECDILAIWQGVKAESDKTSDIYTMNVMLQKFQCQERDLSDEQLYTNFLIMKINHLKKQIELHEKCFIAYFKLERKKYNYGLKNRGYSRTDIPVSNRFTASTIKKFIDELEGAKGIYDKNIQRMRINTSSVANHTIIQEMLRLFIETFEKQKKIHLKEIEYYKELYVTHIQTQNVRVG
jgi:hypothetical protein